MKILSANAIAVFVSNLLKERRETKLSFMSKINSSPTCFSTWANRGSGPRIEHAHAMLSELDYTLFLLKDGVIQFKIINSWQLTDFINKTILDLGISQRFFLGSLDFNHNLFAEWRSRRRLPQPTSLFIMIEELGYEIHILHKVFDIKTNDKPVVEQVLT